MIFPNKKKKKKSLLFWIDALAFGFVHLRA
jgi:hypothetical protein